MEAASSGDDAVLMLSVAEDQNLAVAWSSRDDKNLLRALHDLNFPTWHLIIFDSSKTAIACRERVTQLKRSQPESIPALIYWTKLENT
jgi:NADPH-dependent ferric siderophore reductase